MALNRRGPEGVSSGTIRLRILTVFRFAW
jgi:hypothetical protein